MCRLLYQFFGKIVHKLYSSVGYLQYYSQTIRSMPTTVQIYFRQFVVCNKPYLYVPITCTAILDTTKYTKWSIVSILNYLKSKQNICVHVMDNLKADLQYVHHYYNNTRTKKKFIHMQEREQESFLSIWHLLNGIWQLHHLLKKSKVRNFRLQHKRLLLPWRWASSKYANRFFFITRKAINTLRRIIIIWWRTCVVEGNRMLFHDIVVIFLCILFR